LCDKIKAVSLIKVCGDNENPCRSVFDGIKEQGLSRAV